MTEWLRRIVPRSTGQTAARAKGVARAGPPEGRYLEVTRGREKMIVKLVGKGEKVAVTARTTGLFRPTIYRVLRSQEVTTPP